MAEDDKLKYLTFCCSSCSLSKQCCQDALLYVMFEINYICQSSYINMQELCVCVCVFEHRGYHSANTSSGVMGHDESEPNQCALPLGFIPMLALDGPAQQWPGKIIIV